MFGWVFSSFIDPSVMSNTAGSGSVPGLHECEGFWNETRKGGQMILVHVLKPVCTQGSINFGEKLL